MLNSQLVSADFDLDRELIEPLTKPFNSNSLFSRQGSSLTNYRK
jgi:hypothetical protein